MPMTRESPRTLHGVDLGCLICTDFDTPPSRNASRSSDGIERSNVQGRLPATTKRVVTGPDSPTDSGIDFESGPGLCSDPPKCQAAHRRQPLRPRTRASGICFCVGKSTGQGMDETKNLTTCGILRLAVSSTTKRGVGYQYRGGTVTLSIVYHYTPTIFGGQGRAYDWDCISQGRGLRHQGVFQSRAHHWRRV
jgi:hypothetical protein